ncbi:MAG: hypothetical protein GY942_19425 [Aestuariibacter sp.]|nr:hypothetical protein [Halieaceae bacterium]MCP5012154.1 hypothetical protein [Aestuariibacter sp.]
MITLAAAVRLYRLHGDGTFRSFIENLLAGRAWGFYGDSELDGRETEPTAISPPTVFEIMWVDSGLGAPTSVIRDGASGESLLQHRGRYEADSFAGTPWIHTQESGQQFLTGQTTAAEWGATFQAFHEKIELDYPGSIKSHESAYSFRREAEAGRNWDPYNVELDSRIATLAASGITVIKVDGDTVIKALIEELGGGDTGYNQVCFPDGHANQYHFQAPGNLMIALEMFRAFGYDVTLLNMDGINVSPIIKAACLAAMNTVYGG